IGPSLARRIVRWVQDPPKKGGEDDPVTEDFLTLAHARRVLAEHDFGLNGDLQMHTTFSDGKSTLQEMAAACAQRGYHFAAITDHSDGLRIVRGLSPDDLRRQGEEIQDLNAQLHAAGRSLTLLRGVEMNLDAEGKGDVEPGALLELDLVLGSFHSGLRVEDDQTKRYVAALRNPHVNVLAHPRGRRFGARRGLNADFVAVLEEAARLDKAVEVNAYPDRQDLQPRLLELARNAGCRISIGTDSHHVVDLAHVEIALAMVVEAGIPRDKILNLMEREELIAWASSTRG
ncbi:MAG TPA: PHP domain-containing protein, partial [Actinomycetota bacterium]|nr:PHP domain-containing protein [Actinomycetota bacterium]